MTTQDFIRVVEKHLENNEEKDKDGNIVRNFKVLFGKIKVMGESLQLTSVFPVSEGMSVLFAEDRVIYYEKQLLQDANNPALLISKDAIYIAVNTNTFNEAEKHDFIKTLGHPLDFIQKGGEIDLSEYGKLF
jgi:hypothetical protein